MAALPRKMSFAIWEYEEASHPLVSCSVGSPFGNSALDHGNIVVRS